MAAVRTRFYGREYLSRAAALLVLAAVAVAVVSGCQSGTTAKSPGPGVTHLLNGRNLDSFYTVVEGEGTNNDPDNVFSLVDGMLRISGQHYGYLATKKEYADYRLVAEFKWGDVTWAPRQFKARDGGILVNALGNGQATPTAIECQIIEGGTGSIVVVAGGGLDCGWREARTRRGPFRSPGAQFVERRTRVSRDERDRKTAWRVEHAGNHLRRRRGGHRGEWS